MNSSLGREIVSENEMKRIELISKQRNKRLYESHCLACYDDTDNDLSSDYNSIITFQATMQIIDERKEFSNPNQLDLFEIDFQSVDSPIKRNNDALYTGNCQNCGTEHFLCPRCEEVSNFDLIETNEIQKCEHCELSFIFKQQKGRKGDIEYEEFVILKDDIECVRCADKFTSRGDNSELCVECENYYGTEN